MPTATQTSPVQTLKKQGKHFAKLSKNPHLIGPEILSQLWCPATRLLAMQGTLPSSRGVLDGWHSSAVQSMARSRYLITWRNDRTKAYPMLRHYGLDYINSTTEVTSLTLIHDEPGKSGCVPADGANLTGRVTPKIENGECGATTGHYVVRATPLGKKGVVMLHTLDQTCDLRSIRKGYFHRFFPAANFLMSIRRAAITLRQLAGADPKTLEQGARRLESEVFRNMQAFVDHAALTLENISETTNAPAVNAWVERGYRTLPTIGLGKVIFKVCPDLAYGSDPRTWCAAIYNPIKTETEEEMQLIYQAAWQELIG